MSLQAGHYWVIFELPVDQIMVRADTESERIAVLGRRILGGVAGLGLACLVA
jgi:hypothetical protein